MTFAARIIKCLFKQWLKENKDAEIYAIPQYTVCSALQLQNNDAAFEDIMANYDSSSVYGGEVELRMFRINCFTAKHRSWAPMVDRA